MSPIGLFHFFLLKVKHSLSYERSTKAKTELLPENAWEEFHLNFQEFVMSQMTPSPDAIVAVRKATGAQLANHNRRTAATSLVS